MQPIGAEAALRRRPFVRADADAVVDFCGAHGSDHDAPLLRALLLELTSDPAGVVVLEDAGGEIALVATVVDRVRNGADAAKLETLAVRVPPEASALVRAVVEPAVAFARGGARRALHVALPASLTGAGGFDEALRAAGFAHAYDSFGMRRPGAAPAPAAPGPLPPAWAWSWIDAARVDAAHAALVEIFRDAPATSAKPLDDFRRAIASGAATWRVLLDGDRIAGLVRPVAHGARGEIRIVGRVPGYRGQGLGPRLVAEGLRLLAEGGARDVDLNVEAANERALDLYRRFGFEITARTPVFGIALRP